jgi:hypothetical protein
MKAENFEINEYIKEYLAYNDYANSLECFEAEIRTKQVSAKLMNKQQPKQPVVRQNLPYPRIYGMMKGEQVKGRREEQLEREFMDISKRFTQILAASKQIFSVAVGALQIISDSGLV